MASEMPKPSSAPTAPEERTLSNAKMKLIEARMMEESYGMDATREGVGGMETDGVSPDENSSLPSNAVDAGGVSECAASSASSVKLQLAYEMGKSSAGGNPANPNEILAEMTSSLATLGDWKKSREKSIEEYAALYVSNDGGEGDFGMGHESEVDAILLSCDAERQKALNGTMNNASNLKRILENSKNQRVLPPPPSMTIDESAIQSGEAKLSKLRLDLQCEEWGRSGAIYGNSQGVVNAAAEANAAKMRELETELLEMEAMEARGGGGTEIETMDNELMSVLNKLDALAARTSVDDSQEV